MDGNWTWIGNSPSLIDVKKWELDEASEKDGYCLYTECFYTYRGDTCLHGKNCSANWNSDYGMGFICEQKANLPHINDDQVWWTED